MKINGLSKYKKAFIFILSCIVIFPCAAYYCWQKAIELIGPNRSSMFIKLMPFLTLMAIIILKKFQLFHFIGATLYCIYLSNRKTQ